MLLIKVLITPVVGPIIKMFQVKLSIFSQIIKVRKKAKIRNPDQTDPKGIV